MVITFIVIAVFLYWCVMSHNNRTLFGRKYRDDELVDNDPRYD